MTYRKVQTVTCDKYEALLKEILKRDAKLVRWLGDIYVGTEAENGGVQLKNPTLCQQTDEYLEWLESKLNEWKHDERQ